MAKAHSPPVVPVGVSPTAIAVPQSSSNGASPSSSPAFSPSSSHHPSPHLSATGAKARKKRTKRIVDLDADPGGTPGRPWFTASEESNEPSSGAPTVLTRSPRTEPTMLPSLSESSPAPTTAPVESTQPGPVDRPPPLRVVSPPYKHRRSQTETTPISAAGELEDVPSPLLSRSPAEGTMSVRVSGRRSAARRARATASVFDAPTAKVEEGMEKEADAFRARIEALRSEMGDGWLKVFTQSNAI